MCRGVGEKRNVRTEMRLWLLLPSRGRDSTHAGTWKASARRCRSCPRLAGLCYGATRGRESCAPALIGWAPAGSRPRRTSTGAESPSQELMWTCRGMRWNAPSPPAALRHGPHGLCAMGRGSSDSPLIPRQHGGTPLPYQNSVVPEQEQHMCQRARFF